MPDAQYHWNSHEVKANAGLDNLDFVTFNVNGGQSNLYKEIGESYLHWFHGINPMGKVMLTNMYAYGGDSCVNEFYHSLDMKKLKILKPHTAPKFMRLWEENYLHYSALSSAPYEIEAKSRLGLAEPIVAPVFGMYWTDAGTRVRER